MEEIIDNFSDSDNSIPQELDNIMTGDTKNLKQMILEEYYNKSFIDLKYH